MSDVWSLDGLTPTSPIAGLPIMGKVASTGAVRVLLLDSNGNILLRKITTATMANSAVSVTTNTVILASNSLRIAWAIIHESGDTLYIGTSGVTAANGFPLLGNQPFVSGDFHGELRGTSSAAAISVRVLEWSV